MDNLFSTHPATENRIAALEQLARQMGQSGIARAAPPTSPTFRPSSGPWAGRGPWG